RQQEKVAEFLASVITAARRQILIEATVVEVLLSDRYQSGVDWSALGLQGLGYSFTQSFISGTGTLANTANPFFSIQYSNPNAANGGSLSSTIKLLDQFGNTRVLSSPRILAINNQTAVLKVVDNLVYFTVDVTPATIRSSEFESVLRVPSGSTAILGGLMEDKFDGNRGGLPVLSRIPFFGDLVSF